MVAGGTFAPSFETGSPVTPTTTLLGTIAPNLKTTVSVQRPDQIDAGSVGAHAQSVQQKVDLSTAGQEIERTRAAVIDTLKDARNEIIAATEAAGHNFDEVFPDTRIAPSTGIELLGAAVSGTEGRGSLITATMKGIGVASMAEDISSQMKNQSPEEVRSAIQDVLIQASSPSEDGQSFGLLRDANAPDEIAPSRVDWQNVFQQYPDALQQIAYFDENSYDAKAFPELAQLDADAAAVEMWQGNVAVVQENAIDAPAPDVSKDVIDGFAELAGGTEALRDNLAVGGDTVATAVTRLAGVENASLRTTDLAERLAGKGPAPALYIPPPENVFQANQAPGV